MVNYPEGAFKSEQELLDYCEGRDPFPVYIVESVNKQLLKRILRSPWVKVATINNRDCLVEGWGRILTAIHLQQPYAEENPGFLFANYWHAYGYFLKVGGNTQVDQTEGMPGAV